MRRVGFYSVRRHDGTWTVAEWRGDYWFAIGDSHLLSDSQWWQVGKRLEPEGEGK